MQLNKVLIAGRLTKDPELRYTPSGSAVTTLPLASNMKTKEKETVCYVDISAWGKQAENCSQYLKKGSEVLVEGRLNYRSWKTPEGMRSKLDVVAENVQFLSKIENKAVDSVPGYDEENIPF